MEPQDGAAFSSPPEFAIRVTGAGAGAVRVAVAGELDLLTSPQLGERLGRELASGGEVVLDLSAVEFIDSSGLQTILSAVRSSEVNGSTLSISSALGRQPRRLFEVMGMLSRLPLVDE